MTKAVYMMDEPEWLGIDQNTEVVNPDLYNQLKNFLEDYFCAPSEEEEVKNIS